MKICLILPYFGKLPNYFNFYLISAKYNPEIDWLLITDDTEDYDYPANFTVIYKKLDEIENLISDKLGIEIDLSRPHKLCDVKPAFGHIFEEYLQEYDYWGHCDPDIVWGNFNNFLNWSVLKNYDKIFYLGHLSLYKNSEENNLRYRISLDGKERYREVMELPIGELFDEKFDRSINTIFDENKFSLFKENYAADIDPYYTHYVLSIFDLNKKKYFTSTHKMIFTWENGCIYGYTLKEGRIEKTEYLYIHLQKRKIKNVNGIYDRMIFQNHSIIPLMELITPESFNNFYYRPLLNKQFFRIKFKSLRFKMKYYKQYYKLRF